jgi:hypothetical protein
MDIPREGRGRAEDVLSCKFFHSKIEAVEKI